MPGGKLKEGSELELVLISGIAARDNSGLSCSIILEEGSSRVSGMPTGSVRDL